jgi:hypothetical protein
VRVIWIPPHLSVSTAPLSPVYSLGPRPQERPLACRVKRTGRWRREAVASSVAGVRPTNQQVRRHGHAAPPVHAPPTPPAPRRWRETRRLNRAEHGTTGVPKKSHRLCDFSPPHLSDANIPARQRPQRPAPQPTPAGSQRVAGGRAKRPLPVHAPQSEVHREGGARKRGSTEPARTFLTAPPRTVVCNRVRQEPKKAPVRRVASRRLVLVGNSLLGLQDPKISKSSQRYENMSLHLLSRLLRQLFQCFIT